MPGFPFRRPLLRPRSRQRGGAAVELALIAPVLLTLSFGLLEYGRIVYSYNLMTKAVNAAARHLAVNDRLNDPAARETVRTEALNLVLYGDLEAHQETQVPGLMSDQVSVCTVDNCAGHVVNVSMSIVSVTIQNYQYPPLFSQLFSQLVLGSSLTFNPVSSTMRGRT